MKRSKTFELSVIAVSLLVIFIGCEESTDDNWVTVRGIVTDATTGVPLDSALIHLRDTLTDPAGESDSLGNYSATDLGSAPVEVYCVRTGYVTQMRLVQKQKFQNSYRGINFKMVQQQ